MSESPSEEELEELMANYERHAEAMIKKELDRLEAEKHYD